MDILKGRPAPVPVPDPDCPGCGDSLWPGAICNLGAEDPADDDAWIPCPRCVGKLVRRARLEGKADAYRDAADRVADLFPHVGAARIADQMWKMARSLESEAPK